MLKNKILLLTLKGYTINQIYQELKKDPELKSIDEIEAEKLAESLSYEFVTVIDPEYPKKLRCIESPPCIIYYRGDLQLLNTDAICITGSKFASYYGIMASEDIIKTTEYENIVSGISYGIDKQVIISSLEHHKRVIGVLASNIESVYPSNLKDLCDVIVAHKGLVISVCNPDDKVINDNFIRKNQMMVALSQKVLIVEAKEQSESMYIADYACEQNKEVMAIPGSIYSDNSKGTNLLIQEGASVYNL